MQRIAKFIGSSMLSAKSLNVPNEIYTQCVRWKRKPIWLPTAKSKVFRVPKRPEGSPEEMEEIKRLFNTYRTKMKSIRSHLQAVTMQTKIQTDEAHLNAIADEDFIKCNAINNAWNAQVAAEREKRLEKEKQELLEVAMMRIQDKKQKMEQLQIEADEHIRRLKEESATFITADNIDKAIEKALETVVDHNAALDVNGRVIKELCASSSNVMPIFNKISLKYEAPKRSTAAKLN